MYLLKQSGGKLLDMNVLSFKRDRVWWANSMEKIYDFWEEVKYYRSNDRTELLKRVSKKTNKRRVSESNPYEVEECLIMT